MLITVLVPGGRGGGVVAVVWGKGGLLSESLSSFSPSLFRTFHLLSDLEVPGPVPPPGCFSKTRRARARAVSNHQFSFLAATD